MSKESTIIYQIKHFINHKLWRLRLDKLNKKQSLLLKYLRIISLAFKGFNEDNCLLKSTALTYYTLFSIVPIIALAFAIAKGFGYQEILQNQLLINFQDQKSVLLQAFDYADKMLNNTRGGLIAGVGILLLLWSVMKLLGSVETSFNEIWGIKKDRNWVRKITDYSAIMLIAPIFLILSGGVTVGIETGLEMISSSLSVISPITALFLKLFAFILVWGMFVFIYVALPNTKINFKVALRGGFIAAFLFELLQWAYVASQIGVGSYNKIYGGFAALPLFLIWVQYSWFIVLFGAELTFAWQNVDHFELESDINNISNRYKRVIALMIARLVVQNFNQGGQALTEKEIALKLDLPLRLTKLIIFEFLETGIFNQINARNSQEVAYQSAVPDSILTVKYIIDKLDEKGVNELPIENSEELKTINNLMADMANVLNTSKGNILIKDLI